MTDNTKAFARGEKKQLAIKIIEDNLDKDFFEVANLISIALDLNTYAGRAYYKYMVKHGLISKYKADETPWKVAKAATKEKAPKEPKPAKVKADKPAKKVKASTPAPEAGQASTEVTVSTDEKPATKMLREFIKKQKAAAKAA